MLKRGERPRPFQYGFQPFWTCRWQGRPKQECVVVHFSGRDGDNRMKKGEIMNFPKAQAKVDVWMNYLSAILELERQFVQVL